MDNSIYQPWEYGSKEKEAVYYGHKAAEKAVAAASVAACAQGAVIGNANKLARPSRGSSLGNYPVGRVSAEYNVPSPAIPKRPVDTRSAEEASASVQAVLATSDVAGTHGREESPSENLDVIAEYSSLAHEIASANVGSILGNLTPYTGTEATGTQLAKRHANRLHERRYHGLEDILLNKNGTVRKLRKDGTPRRRRVTRKTRG
jgi:hypothetical protein